MSPSSRFAVRHYSNAALVFLFPPSHSSMQGVERLFQETHVPLCRIGGKCAGFRAKTVEVSGHLPTSRPHERHWRPTPIREICTLSTGYHLPQPRIIARIWPFLRLTATTGPMGHINPRFSRKCLIENGCLDLFEVCRLHRLLSFH
jgi:hypothetical protein